MTKLVEVSELVKRYSEQVAVDEASLEISEGEVVGLLGANGAGKTTLIRCLLGLLDFDSGRVSLLGESPNRNVLRRVGYVPQGLGLYSDLTVEENLDFRREIFGSPRIEGVVDDRRVDELPHGLQRRAAFTAALAHRPQILILDEPTSGVGPWTRAELWDTIRAEVSNGAGALVTTHHLDEAEYCDRLVLMAAGRVVKSGSLSELISGETAVEVTTDRRDEAFAALTEAALLTVLSGSKLRVVSADEQQVTRILSAEGIAGHAAAVAASLDEVFIATSSR